MDLESFFELFHQQMIISPETSFRNNAIQNTCDFNSNVQFAKPNNPRILQIEVSNKVNITADKYQQTK